MNKKGQVFSRLVIVALLLVACAALLLLIVSSKRKPVSSTQVTTAPGVTVPTAVPVEITEAPTQEVTQEPTQEPTQEAAREPTQEPTQEPTAPSAVQQRVDSQPVTDAETVERLEAYAEQLGDARQVLLVLAQETKARVTLHEKGSDGLWHTTCVANGFVGKNGVGEVFEGSGKTPQGVHGLSIAFGIKEDPGALLPYTQVDDSHYWVDDPDSAYYNQFVTTKEVKKDWESAEHLIKYKPSYHYAIAIDYNLDCVPGAGSAFFVHCSSGKPTLGCVSVSEADMLFLLKTIGGNACIVIAQQ